MTDIVRQRLAISLWQVTALNAEVNRLTEGIRQIITDQQGAPCSYWACPGSDHPPVGMATCNACDRVHELRALIGDPEPTCTSLECGLCGKESPWCEECDEKLFYCKHCPPGKE
jgi:hypothetical protein